MESSWLWLGSRFLPAMADASRSRTRSPQSLLHVRNFSVHKRDFEIFINPDLLRAEIDDLVRLAEGTLHLIGGLSLLDGLRLGLRLGLLRLLLPALLILSSLTLSGLTLLAFIPALILLLSIFANGKQLPDCVLDVTSARLRQRSLGEHEDHRGFVISRRIGLVACVASNDPHRHRILFDAHVNLARIHLVALGEQFRRLSLRLGLRKMSQ